MKKKFEGKLGSSFKSVSCLFLKWKCLSFLDCKAIIKTKRELVGTNYNEQSAWAPNLQL